MRRRNKVTAVHKANNFIITDGFFLECVRNVHEEFPTCELNEVIIDAMAAHLVRDASRYDVIVATNFYADILSDSQANCRAASVSPARSTPTRRRGWSAPRPSTAPRPTSKGKTAPTRPLSSYRPR